MRLFSGFSFKIGRRARAGVSASGRPWLGARARGPAGLYAGAITSTGRGVDAASPRLLEVPGPARLSLNFDVDDDGTVTLGGARVNVEQLRSVVQLSDELRQANRRSDR